MLAGGMGGDGFESKIEQLGVPFNPLPLDQRSMNPWNDIKLFLALYKWYRRERPEVVHHFTIKPVIYGSLAAQLAGVPRIINTITGLGFTFIEENMVWLRRLVKCQYKLALRGSHFTFFQNVDDLQYFVSHRLVHARKTRLAPGSGIDSTWFSPGAAEGKSAEKGTSFLLVARVLREKGVYEFVEAARLVKAEFHDASFVILGRRDELNPSVVPRVDLDRWQAEGIIRWLGEVLDVRSVLAKVDVVVLPSYREGLPRSLLEAASMAKPIIAADTPGCREVVAHGVNGLLVPVKEVNALAHAMVKMIQHPEMRACMGKLGREKVRQQFEQKHVTEIILNAYVEEGKR